MAEYNIADNAGIITPDFNTTGPWMCRDDSGNYWTIFQNVDNNIAIYKSINLGVNWILMKTLTASDFIGLTFPPNTFNIAHLIGQNKVYIFLANRAYPSKCWGWVINTLTDVGVVDLNNVTLTTTASNPLSKIEIRWSSNNNKLYTCQGTGYLGTWVLSYHYFQEIKLDGTLGTAETYSNDYFKAGGGCAIDNLNNRFFVSLGVSGGGSFPTKIHRGGSSIATGYYNQSYVFSNVVCNYDNKAIFGFIIGTTLHLYQTNSGFSGFEINDAQLSMSEYMPNIIFLTVDGNGDIYWIYTNSSNNEAYYVKYTVAPPSWGSPTMISSNNDGKLVCPELRPLLVDNKILVSYQAIV